MLKEKKIHDCWRKGTYDKIEELTSKYIAEDERILVKYFGSFIYLKGEEDLYFVKAIC